MKIVSFFISTALFFSACNSTHVIALKNDNYTIISLLEEDVSSSNMTIAFDTETKQISGHAGCNTYFGGYIHTDSTITFTEIASTKKYCPDKEVNRKEKALLHLFSEVTTMSQSSTNEIVFKNNKDQVVITAIIQ